MSEGKKCPICGKPVPPPKKHGNERIYCSRTCCQKARKRNSRLRAKQLADNEARLRKERMERRDREYEHSPYSPPVTVEERDLRDSTRGCILRVETRGRICIAPKSGFIAL